MTREARSARDAVERVLVVCGVLDELTQMEYAEFATDMRTQWAVEMGLIRIGEGVRKIPDDVLATFDGQPWRLIVGMRNFAAHQYDDLDPARVWRTVTRDVPALRTYLSDTVLEALE